MTIEEIKNYCIDIDVANMTYGDVVGPFVDGEIIPFDSVSSVKSYYSDISIKRLLEIFSAYNGLDCLKSDGESLVEHGYFVDIASLIENL